MKNDDGTKKSSPARAAVDQAHRVAAPAMGEMSLLLSALAPSLSRGTVLRWAARLRRAADILESMVK